MKTTILAAACALPLLAGPASSEIKPDDAPAGVAGKALSALPVPSAPPKGFSSMEGGPTVMCDDNGGYRVDMKGKEILPFAACLRKHEEQHIADYKAKCPAGCKGKTTSDYAPYFPDNYGGCPVFKDGAAWKAWRTETECKSYIVQYQCASALYKKAFKEKDEALKSRIRAHLCSAVRKGLGYYKCEYDEIFNLGNCSK